VASVNDKGMNSRFLVCSASFTYPLSGICHRHRIHQSTGVFVMNGWLSPRGKFYSCGIMEHTSKAGELFLDEKNPEKLVEDMNWIKITPNYILGPWDNKFIKPQNVTQSQIDFLFDLVNSDESTGDYKFMFNEIMESLK